MKKKLEYLFSEADKLEIQRLAKVAVATHNDCESIYNLFKKYINKEASMYRLDCTCYNSISNYWKLLIEFYSANSDKTK